MSDKLMINGRKYVSASVAANMTKYTQDYVGQLCRGNKVNATRIGRNWYVDIDSLLLHKEQSERGVVEIKISTQRESQREEGSIEETPEELVKPEPVHQKEERIKPEIDQIPTQIPLQRIIGDRIADYTHDTRALLPPLKKISTETEVEEVSAPTQKEFLRPKPEESIYTPKLRKNTSPSLFSRIGSVLWLSRERLALGLILIVMFSSILVFNSRGVVYIHDSVATTGSEVIEWGNILTYAVNTISIFEATAMEFNGFVDDAIYDFLYTP